MPNIREVRVQIFVLNVLIEVRKLPQSVTFLALLPVFVSRFKIRDFSRQVLTTLCLEVSEIC
jgi:hypothetical protein